MPWELKGNAGISAATDFLGTTDAQPLVVKTNGAEAMRINANRNVGIGTATPQAQLHVSSLLMPHAIGRPMPNVTQIMASRVFLQPKGVNSYEVIDLVLKDGNVGIGAPNPGAKLTVAGVVESTSEGFRYPDGSMQKTATL